MTYREAILKRFEGISKPLTKCQALKSTSKASKKAFENLLLEGEIVNMSTGKDKYDLVTKEQFETTFSPQATCRKTILKLIEGAVRLISLTTELKKNLKLSQESSKMFLNVIYELQREGLVRLLTAGNRTFLISIKALLGELEDKPIFEQLVGPKPMISQAAAKLPADQIFATYEKLKNLNRGIETVLIYDLLKILDVPKESLHKFIRDEAKAGRATFHTAAAASLSKEVLDAGIRLDGESHPYVSVVLRSNP